MFTETERKFLPADPDWRPSGPFTTIAQGYFKMGENARGTIDWKLPRPAFCIDGEDCTPLSWFRALALRRHFVKGELPKGWKARIRSYDDDRFVLDLKGPRVGASRAEFDQNPLYRAQGEKLQARCGETLLVKDRYELTEAGQTYHVDVYKGAHAWRGVVIELEQKKLDNTVKLASWVGREITNEKLFP